VSACGSNGLSDNGDGGGADMAMSTSGDMAMSTSTDLAGQMCDPVTQNCTDPNNPKCGLVISGTGMNRMITGQCEPNGTAARDTMCTIDMTTGMDDCVKGTRCTATGLPMGSMPLCRLFCGKDADCGTGQSCRAAIGGGGGGTTTPIGICIPSCTPFGTDCGTGKTCAMTNTDIASTMTKRVLFLSCRATGTTPLWATCQASTDCVDNAVCSRATMTCVPLCDNSNACPNMPDQSDAGTGGSTPTTCMPDGLPNNGGTCG